MVEKFAKMMSTKCKTKTKLILLSLSEKRLRHQAERRAAEAEKCLRQALQKTKLQSLRNLLSCKKRAKGDVAQSETAALTSDDWLLDTCGPEDSECSADGGKIHSHSRRVFSIVMSEYPEPKKLLNALNDAEEVGKVFGKLDYAVESPAKNVPKDTLQGMFSEFLDSLDTKTYTVILHIAGHGFEQDGNLVLALADGSQDSEDSKVYVDKLLSDLNNRLDKIVLESKSEDDPVHSVGVLVIWDACREAINIPARSKGRRQLRERQQAIIHSCMFGGRSEEAVAGSKNVSPLILALSDLLRTSSPFTVFELAEHLNARVKDATKGRQSVELRSEATKLNSCYDWFVDLENCNKLRAHDVVLKRLQAPIHDVKACARLISLWRVPCKSIESVEDVEDCLQSLQDSRQRHLSDLRAHRIDATVRAERRADEEKRLRQKAEREAAEEKRLREEAERRAAKAERLRPREEVERQAAERQAAKENRLRQEPLQERDRASQKAREAQSLADRAIRLLEFLIVDLIGRFLAFLVFGTWLNWNWEWVEPAFGKGLVGLFRSAFSTGLCLFVSGLFPLTPPRSGHTLQSICEGVAILISMFFVFLFFGILLHPCWEWVEIRLGYCVTFSFACAAIKVLVRFVTVEHR